MPSVEVHSLLYTGSRIYHNYCTMEPLIAVCFKKDIQPYAKYAGKRQRNGFTQGKIIILVFQGDLRQLYIVVNLLMGVQFT